MSISGKRSVMKIVKVLIYDGSLSVWIHLSVKRSSERHRKTNATKLAHWKVDNILNLTRTGRRLNLFAFLFRGGVVTKVASQFYTRGNWSISEYKRKRLNIEKHRWIVFDHKQIYHRSAYPFVSTPDNTRLLKQTGEFSSNSGSMARKGDFDLFSTCLAKTWPKLPITKNQKIFSSLFCSIWNYKPAI